MKTKQTENYRIEPGAMGHGSEQTEGQDDALARTGGVRKVNPSTRLPVKCAITGSNWRTGVKEVVPGVMGHGSMDEDQQDMHVSVRVGHLKNGDLPLTHAPNASGLNSITDDFTGEVSSSAQSASSNGELPSAMGHGSEQTEGQDDVTRTDGVRKVNPSTRLPVKCAITGPNWRTGVKEVVPGVMGHGFMDEDQQDMHVSVRVGHLKNGDLPLTHAPNASGLNSITDDFTGEVYSSAQSASSNGDSAVEPWEKSSDVKESGESLFTEHSGFDENATVRVSDLDTPNLVHVCVRSGHLKNSDSLLTHSPNASELSSPTMRVANIMKVPTKPLEDGDGLEVEGRYAQYLQCPEPSDSVRGRGRSLVDNQVDVKSRTQQTFSHDVLIEDLPTDVVDKSIVQSKLDTPELYTIPSERQVCPKVVEINSTTNPSDNGKQWKPAGVHTGEVCTEAPAPHCSDGGITPQSIGVSVYVPERQSRHSKSCGTSSGRSTYIRVPSVQERRKLSASNSREVFAVKDGSQSGSIWLTHEEACAATKDTSSTRQFAEFSSLARNIKAAKTWIQEVSLNPKASAFVPTASPCESAKQSPQKAKPCETDEEQVVWPTVRPKTASESEMDEDIPLREILRHKQVSHVRGVAADVREKMQSFATCCTENLIMDFAGTTAGRIQRQLRKELVADLSAGNDTAAFVCSQLGIDNAPRCDQLELLFAAMPGIKTIVCEGDRAESGLNIREWMLGHATHCDKGCTGTLIKDDCYFRIMHHFMLRGFDPVLKEGCEWKNLKTCSEAYVKAWNKDPKRCAIAWEKWKSQAAGLLSPPVSKKPDLVIPLLPATRAKQVWRYHRNGTPYKVRLCLDLKSSRVNASLADWRFKYRGLDDIASRIKKGDWLASVDISRFYLRLPAGPNLRNAQWVQDPETYAKNAKLNKKNQHKRWRQLLAVGFGLKTAPAWASAVSAELVRILEAAGVRVVGCFIDDILIAGRSKEECQQALDKAIKIMEKLGIPANEKTVPPQDPEDGIVFLGMHIRTADMRFTVSEEHREYAIARLTQALQEGKATKRTLASIAGVLTWISFVFLPGRPRRQHIYDAAGVGGEGDKSEEVIIERSLQRQLQWWRNALKRKEFTGTRFWETHENPRALLMKSDASGEDGWGMCVRGIHLVGPWPEQLKDANMLFKELVPMVITIALLSKKLPETVFAAATDNTGSAFAMNRLTCRDRLSLRLLQQTAQDLEEGGHTSIASHVYRHRNQHADDLSHNLFEAQWKRIINLQGSQSQRVKEGYWIFPFVAHCMRTGEVLSGQFRMRKELFSSTKMA